MWIARLWLLGTGMLWVMCWSGHKAYGQGVGLTLNSMTLPNNSIVTNTDITSTALLVCTTTYTPCCTGFGNPDTHWYFPNRSEVMNQPTDLPYRRTRGQSPGRVILIRNSDTTTTGIFHCDIPDESGDIQSLYVGIYDSGTGTPTATTLVYSETTRSLTCTSTGGPATTVTWRKDGAVITINATYQQTQVVTDPVTGTYQTVLTIDQSVTDVSGTYSCTVGNTRGTSAAIETTVFSLLVSITPGANPTAGQSYTFTCTVTPQGGLTGTLTVQWRGLGSSDPISTGGDFTVSTTPSYTLTIDPLRQSHDGQYTCQAAIGATTGSSSATLTVTAPSVSVAITPAGTALVGQLGYSLSCSVSGADSLSPTIAYHWYNESSNPRSQVGTTSIYSFPRLRPYHAGQYTCEANVASPYLNEDLSQSMMQDITLQIPVPMVSIFHPGVASAYAGSQLTLTCAIVLDSTLFPVLGDLVVTSVWTGPGSGMLSSDGRVTVSPASLQVLNTFASTVMFNTLRISDAGTYTCEATVAPRGSTAGTVTNGVRSASRAAPTIINPTIQLELTSNTTRLPNTAPYNTFSLTCTATVPQGVVSPKTFNWRRRIGPQTGGLTDITVNSSILITSTNLDQPTSTSVLTVRETIAGDYRYRCRVDLSELTVANTTDVYPINVTGPANPVQPQNLMDISTCHNHNRATVHWSVSYIAYTPENFTVNYGRAMNSLDMAVTATHRGENFTIPSQPFMFSAELTGLDPGVTYYYQVEARNSVGPTLSAVQQFTSNELPPNPPRMFQITAVTTTSLSFSWQEPANPNGFIMGYQLSCQPLLLGIPTPESLSPGPTAQMTVMADLIPGVRYNCSIGAMNSAGLSCLVYADGTTTEIAPAGPPLNFMVTAGARSMTFSWTPPNATQRNGVVTGYYLSCTPLTAGGDITMQYTQDGTFTLGGFTPFTTYSCSIFASNHQGDGPVTSMTIHTEEDSPDAAPQSVVFQHDRDSPEMVFFSWQPLPPDQQNGVITRYDIVCTPSSGSGESVSGMNSDSTLNATVGMFTPATQYSCTITASTSAGTGPGNTVTVVTLPAAPENVTLTNSFPLLRVMWSIDPPNGVISHYTIYVTRLEMGNTVLTNTSTNTQFDIPEGGLIPYELVLVSVSASNSAGEGARSPGVRGRTREQPPGIVGCPPRWTDLPSAIQVEWTPPQRPNGIIMQYYLLLTNFGGNTAIASTIVNSSGSLTYDFTARLDDGVPYTVQIFAENSAGNGTVCNVTDFTNELEPPAPSGVTVTRVSDTVIRVMWQPLSLVEARGHIRYRVMVTSTTVSKRKRQATQGERMCTLMSPCEVPANESSVLVGGLDLDTSYSVTVVAVNSENEDGSTSAPVIATRVQTTGTSVVGIVVGIVVGFVVVIIIMGAVIGVLIAKNRRYKLSIQEHAGKDQSVRRSAVAKSGDADIITTQCEAYGLAEFGHEYEELPTSEMTSKPPNPEYEIPTAQCPAYVPTSQQKERVEEGEYETV